jgi:hypothetical protein
MSKERIVIDQDLRPPVALHEGRSPIRNTLKNSRINSESKRLSPKARGVTEDGKLVCEFTWDQRHHISPSLFNDQNHIFYKVFLL